MQRTNWAAFAAVALGVCLNGGFRTAVAGDLALVADSIVWDPMLDGPNSPAMTLRLTNDTDPDTETLQGWMISLAIVPDPSSTGTLTFAARNLPASNYVLAGDSAGLAGSLLPASLLAFDDALSAVGAVVPTSGASLLEIAFSTPDDARGLFFVVATPGLGSTGWSDGDFNDREFVNAPFSAGQPVVLGQVTVVPEPAAVVLALQLAVVVLYLLLRRRRVFMVPSS